MWCRRGTVGRSATGVAALALPERLENFSVVIAGLVPAIHLASAWTTGTSPVVTMMG
ncbi:hypothetical protein [Devosia sp.]|uniref:hypothetical protein n=1 Tax=Devosia sp. TaxID=1871048 RepID=UPI0025F2BA93|nr:hypothetical protein [Devosia sp.]